MLEAYRQWGLDGFARLVGAFAFSLWDPHERRLILAADGLGFRPLYLHVSDKTVVFASKARALLDALEITPQADLDFIAAFLTNSITDRGPYDGVETVPGGHLLVVDDAGVRRHRYWHFDPAKEIRYRSESEYEEHFNELFDEAIACRMRSAGPVFAELSGGVDSSSIVCVAGELMQRGAAPQKPLHTISYVFDQAASADERPYIREIEKVVSLKTHHLREEDNPILSKRPPVGFAPDLPTNQISYLARYDRVSELMAEHGGRVLLSGLGGDQAFLSENLDLPLELAEHWIEGRPIEMLRSGYRWARALHRPFLQVLYEGTVLPLGKKSWQKRARRVKVGEWLRPSFVDQTSLRERGLGPGDDLGFKHPSRSFQYSVFRQTMRIFALQKCVSHGHFDVRYPYLDRRLLEFGLALPLEQKLRPHESRSIVRRALRGRVPASVLERRTKAGPTEAFQRAMVRERQWLSQLFAEPRLAEIGVIDAGIFRTSLERARHGLVSHPAQMHRTVSLELWLRSLESAGGESAVRSA